MSAVQNGKCIDTSMGLTPLEGLMMGTRCGSIDPAIVPFMMEKKGMTPQEADTVLNKQSRPARHLRHQRYARRTREHRKG